MEASFAGLILAGGRGSRFAAEPGPQMPKVLRHILGKPMISYVILALRKAGISNLTIVVGYRGDEVVRALGNRYHYVTQPEQRGSGDAAACAEETFAGFEGHLVVMCGDSPMFSHLTIRAMMATHVRKRATVTLASAELDDPTGYGRIVRNDAGDIVGIVEEKCADDAQRAIREVNGGAYVFDSRWLFGNIDRMAINEAGEYNLTDMVRVALEQGRKVLTVRCNPGELAGVNTPEQLAAVEEIIRWQQLR